MTASRARLDDGMEGDEGVDSGRGLVSESAGEKSRAILKTASGIPSPRGPHKFSVVPGAPSPSAATAAAAAASASARRSAFAAFSAIEASACWRTALKLALALGAAQSSTDTSAGNFSG